MALVDQVKRIIVSPATEWPIIGISPPVPPPKFFSSYIVPLALIPPVCSLISGLGFSVFLHTSFIAVIIVAVLTFILELVNVLVVSLIAKTLAPSFNGIGDSDAALKWIAYSYTPRWVAGIGLLIPVVGFLISLVGSLYSLYVLYLGAVPMMKVPQDKAIGYVVVVILVAIVVSVVISAIALGVGAMFAAGAIMSTGAYHS